MTETTPGKDALSTAQELTDTLKETVAEVRRLRKYGRTNRKFVLIDIVLSVALAVVAVIGVHASQTAASANSAQLALCQAGNVARHQQIALWTYALHLGKQPRTAAEQKVVVAFEDHLHRIFASRDCATLGQPKQ